MKVYRHDHQGTSVTATQLALPIDETQIGESRLYRMTLPFLPPSKNVYDGWLPQWKHSAKAKWIRHIGAEARALQMPTGVQQVGLAAVLVFPTKNRRDVQNYSNALWHWVPDALVRAGVLVDDSEGRVQVGANWGIRFAYDLRPGLDKKHRSRTVLAITMRV